MSQYETVGGPRCGQKVVGRCFGDIRKMQVLDAFDLRACLLI
jgi:hypothetical protein